ncbi:calcium-binding protein [Sphaerotilus sp.]|uniref:calcium-binding protein n=1 Tax=Sphaerotilus sp. TaxID=2093942 RepID=UPI00286EB0DC|nr:calcium-binding protein [Sphaerotilus sp.]
MTTVAGLSAAAALVPNLVSGTSAAETLNGTAGVDEIFGNGQNDLISAGDGNDTLWGGSGNDTLNGGAGDDLLVGEGGDDQLDGGSGSDTYRVTGNAVTGFSGFDTYADTGASGTDKIAAVGTGDVDIGLKGNFGPASGIESVDATGATGTVRLLGDNTAQTLDFRGVTLLGANLLIDGAYGNDTVYGSAAADTIVGGSGNDVLDGGAGGDTYRVTGNEAGGWSSFHNFDAYADTGASGTDKIVALGAGDVDVGFLGNFGAGNGIEAIDATGATGTVRLYGDGSGTTLDFRGTTITGTNVVIDSNYGNDTLFGSAGADTVLASWGDDVFDGAGGGDTYRVTGNTATAFQGYDTYADSGTSGVDRIVALGASDVDIGLKGWSATGVETIDASGATGTVRLIGTNTAELFDLRTTTLVGSNIVLDAGWGNDTVYGSAGNDTVANNQGDDRLDGAGGSDTLRVSGNLLSGFQGYDTYADSGASGTDRIVALGIGDVDIGTRGWSGTGIETIDGTGATGTVRLISTNAADVFDLRTTTLVGSNIVLDAGWGNDTVYGSAGNDTIDNNQGDDLLDGAEGGDTVRVSGNTSLNFQGYDVYRDSGTRGTDRIVVMGGTLAVDIGLKGWSATGIEQIDATGTTGVVRLLDTNDANLLDFRATTLTGSNLVIDTGYGNDTVYGSAAADTFLAGSGNDVLDGGAGGDTYRVTGNEAGGWGSFHGFDTYADTGTSGTDRIVALGTGDVDIGVLGNFGAGSGIEAVDGTGATGTVRLYGDGSATTLDFRAVAVIGTNVVIDSNYGNDTVYGTAGADTVFTSFGDDVLDGAGGGDTYRVTGNTATAYQGYDTYKDSGATGVDRIVAAGTGDVDIGLLGSFSAAGSGIEAIDATGAAGTVRILGDNAATTLDLRGVTLSGTRLLIDAGNGNDVVYGSAADDTLVSNNGEDTVDGAGGADLYRVSGNETTGFHGYDTYKDSGTTGSDRIVVTGATTAVDIGIKGWNATGIEQIDSTGTTGVVRLLDTGDANLLDFRTTTLTGSNLVIAAGYGNDTVYGSAAADTIVGGSGNDVLDGGAGGDTYRVTGNEAGGWSSFHNFDTYADTGASGTDKIVALGAGDVDVGFLGNFGAGNGIEAIDATGATGTVRLYGDGSGTTLDFRGTTITGTNVVIDSNYGNDTIFGSAGADTVLASWGDDVFDGAGGGDTYRVTGNTATAFQGYDTYADSGTSGVDRIVALGAGDVDIGFKGNFGPASGIEAIDASGATGTVRLLGESSAQTLDFRGVTLTGTRLLIDAGGGNDVVYGSAGADTLVSNNGDDTVDGAGGADTYRVTGNTTTGFHGYDTYKDSGASGMDTVVALGTGDVDIGLLGSFGAANGIEAIDATGAAGTVRLLGDNSASTLDFRTVTLTGTRLLIDAANGNDVVYGSAGADTLVSNNGDDTVDGAGGADTYRVTGNTTTGFHGRDTYKDSGTTGTDTLAAVGTGNVDIGVINWQGTGIEVIDGTGATGTVRVWANDSANVLDFSATTFVGGNVLIDGAYGNDTIKGSAGADLINGGGDADVLDGQNGSDTYRVTGNRASGWSSFQGFDTYADTGTSGMDRIVALGAGDVDIGVAGWQNTGIEGVDATGATGTVRLLGQDSADVLDFRTTTLTGANLVIDGGYSNDTLFGSAGADTIVGAGNDDLIDGAGGGDTFRVTGNAAGGWSSFHGYDTYRDTGSGGVDRLVALGTGAVDIGLASWQDTGVEVIDGTGATGTVRLLGGDGATVFDFRATALTGSNFVIDGAWGNDTLIGSAGADQIVGGGGDDRLDGFDGGDTYRVTGNLAEGWASFQGFDTYVDTGTTGTDTLLAQGAGDVDIGMLSFDAASGIEVVDTRAVVGQTRLLGSWSDDVLDFSGTSILGSRVVIDGSGGTDLIIGSAGNDTIIGGTGADSMAGGAGNDVYRVGRGTSLDVIWDYDETAGNQDTVEFGAGIGIDQLWFKRLDGFLEVSVIGSWDRVYVMDWDTGPASQVEKFRTVDGHVLLNSRVDALITAMAAFDAPSSGTTVLPDTYRTALLPVITSAWS